MISKPSFIAYVAYAPPYKGLPYLSVTFMPDGSVVAVQFQTEAAAIDHMNKLARAAIPPREGTEVRQSRTDARLRTALCRRL